MTLSLPNLALVILVTISAWLLLKIFSQRRYWGLVRRYGEACARHGLTAVVGHFEAESRQTQEEETKYKTLAPPESG